MLKTFLPSLSNQKISLRVGFGFGLLLMLFIAGSLYSWNNLNNTQKSFTEYARVSGESAAILEIDHQIVDLHASILVYSQTGHKTGEKKILSNYEKMEKGLAKIRQYNKDQNRTDLLARMDVILKNYNEAIISLFADRQRFDLHINSTMPEAVSKVRVALFKLTADLDPINNSTLHESFDTVRQHFLRAQADAGLFLANRDSSFQRSAKKSLSQALGILAELKKTEQAPKPQAMIISLQSLLSKYQTGFNQAIQATRGYLFLTNVIIPGEAAEFSNLSTKLKASTLARLNTLTETTSQDIIRTQTITTTTMTFSILIGILLTFFIGKSIVSPIQSISDTFMQLVEHKQVGEIPGLERKDEIGKLASAANVFKKMSETNEGNLRETEQLTNELKERSGELRETNQELVQEVQLRSKAQEIAEAASQAKSEFLATISHELRTPLTSIKGSISLIRGTMAENLTPQALSLLDITSRNSETLMVLINDMLDYEKALSGMMSIDLAPYNINEITQIEIETNQDYAKSKDVRFICTECDEIIWANINEQRFGQILRNLLSNAAKFSNPGGKVEISVIKNPDTVQVNVRDYGMGIAPEHRDKIFDRFVQIDSSDTRIHSGTGLGLSICRILTEAMGGTIDFTSEVGKGSTFFIKFPIQEIPSEVKQA